MDLTGTTSLPGAQDHLRGLLPTAHGAEPYHELSGRPAGRKTGRGRLRRRGAKIDPGADHPASAGGARGGHGANEAGNRSAAPACSAPTTAKPDLGLIGRTTTTAIERVSTAPHRGVDLTGDAPPTLTVMTAPGADGCGRSTVRCSPGPAPGSR
jgi:hypothetical protein